MPAAPSFSSILVGTDGSATAAIAVERAISLAREVGARLVIVSAFEPVDADRVRSEREESPADPRWAVGPPRDDAMVLLDETLAAAREAGVSDVVSFARQGDAADAIIDVAEEQQCDLIIVGNKGKTGARRFLLGSVPNKISHHAPCSVLIVRTS